MTTFFEPYDGWVFNPTSAVAAIITADNHRFLMQLRDDIQGIFYPGHWGFFGGAVDDGESETDALSRELQEEIGVAPRDLSYFTRVDYDFGFVGCGRIARRYYVARLDASELQALRLGEGASMNFFTADEVFDLAKVVPFDAYALWLFAKLYLRRHDIEIAGTGQTSAVVA